MMRRYSRLRSSSSANSSERDTYLFQDADDPTQTADVSAGKISTKSIEKPENLSIGKHFMASIRRVTSLKEKLHRSNSSPAGAAPNSDETAEAPYTLPADPPAFTTVPATHPPADSRKTSTAEDSHANPTPSLERSTSVRDSSTDMLANGGSLGAAVHRALSVREGRLNPADGHNPPPLKDNQIRIVLNREFPKEQIKLSTTSDPRIISKSSETPQDYQKHEKDHKKEASRPHEGVDQNDALAQKAVKKTQSMRCSSVATEVEESWVPARNSSFFGPISLQKGSIFRGFNGVNLSYTYSTMDEGDGSPNCSICGCEIASVVHAVKHDYSVLCNSCYVLHTANERFDPPKDLKKRGGLIKACRRILHLSKRSSFS